MVSPARGVGQTVGQTVDQTAQAVAVEAKHELVLPRPAEAVIQLLCNDIVAVRRKVDAADGVVEAMLALRSSQVALLTVISGASSFFMPCT